MTDIDNKINTFRYVMINNFNDLDLSNFYSNLSTLKVIKSTDEVYGKLNYFTNSYYDCEKNTIIIKKNKINDNSFYHELFHMASNASEKKIVRNGFYLGQYNLNIGLGINEGYTEYLTRKYFGKLDNSYTYEFEVTIAKNIENIIGNYKMESLYLRAQLKGLIDELSLYSDNDDIMSFIENVDFVHYYIYQDDMLEEILLKVRKINEFIINLRIKKYGLSYLENNSLLKVNYESEELEKFNDIQNDNFIKNVIDHYQEKNKLK